MTFKFALTAAAATLILAACGPKQIITAGDGSAICPAAEIISDVSVYPNAAPAPMDDLAAWHTANGERSGVVTTESGLQYSVLKKGNEAGPSPTGGQIIKVNYHGLLPSGETFDSSYDRGEAIEFPANRVIKGWIEGLGMMKPCDAWTLYIPADLAYGKRGAGALIGPDQSLIFHVQLLEVK